MAEHPLASLRASLGLSHPSYAQLVSETHARLGFGSMAARREKVSRWESGRTVPEFTAQLAIADIHRVRAEDVERLGWPDWLHLATDDAVLHQPWTSQGVLDVLHRSVRIADAPPHRDLALTGPGLLSQAGWALSDEGAAAARLARDGRTVNLDAVVWIEIRTQALELHESGTSVAPVALLAAAHAEHRLITSLLTEGGYGSDLGTRLLGLAARTATLCAWLSSSLGEEARAERYALAAIRAATAAGARRHVATYMSQLAIRHILIGDPGDALALVDGARVLVPRPSAHFAASLHTKEALARARLGEVSASAHALDRAAEALALDATEQDPADGPFDIAVDEDYLAIGRGNAWLFLGQPRKALPHFSPLLTDGPALTSPYTARRLLQVVDAQLALGELDAAAHSAHRAVAVTGSLPSGLARQYRQRFSCHQAEPVARNVLDLLADAA